MVGLFDGTNLGSMINKTCLISKIIYEVSSFCEVSTILSVLEDHCQVCLTAWLASLPSSRMQYKSLCIASFMAARRRRQVSGQIDDLDLPALALLTLWTWRMLVSALTFDMQQPILAISCLILDSDRRFSLVLDVFSNDIRITSFC